MIKAKSSIRKRFTAFRGIGLMLLFTLLFSCSNNDKEGRLIAKVGDDELYSDDLPFAYYNPIDSAEIVSRYVQNWVDEQILVQAAVESEELDMKSIDRKVEKFRNELIIYELENQKLDEKLDTNVAEAEIENYYRTHKDEFQLNDYLVKVLYLKVPFDAPNIERISSAYKLGGPDDLKSVEVYAKMYATNFYYDIQSWIYFDDLLKEIPLQDINKDRFILKRSKIRFEEGGFHYFLNIVDYKLKNTLSPLSFERANIKARIINLRITTLREKIKNDLIKEAYNEGKVELF